MSYGSYLQKKCSPLSAHLQSNLTATSLPATYSNVVPWYHSVDQTKKNNIWCVHHPHPGCWKTSIYSHLEIEVNVHGYWMQLLSYWCWDWCHPQGLQTSLLWTDAIHTVTCSPSLDTLWVASGHNKLPVWHEQFPIIGIRKMMKKR